MVTFEARAAANCNCEVIACPGEDWHEDGEEHGNEESEESCEEEEEAGEIHQIPASCFITTYCEEQSQESEATEANHASVEGLHSHISVTLRDLQVAKIRSHSAVHAIDVADKAIECGLCRSH